MAQRLGLKQTRGVQITRFFEDGPAAKAHLEYGDVIVSVAGKSIKDTSDLQSTVAGLPFGKPVLVAVMRDGKVTHLRRNCRRATERGCQPAQVILTGGTGETPVPTDQTTRLSLAASGITLCS